MNFYTLVDGRHYADEETWNLLSRVQDIQPSLISSKKTLKDKWISISFVGIIAFADCVICCFPKRLIDPPVNGFNDEAEQLISLVARSLIRYRDDRPPFSEDVGFLYSTDESMSTPLLVALEIIQDFEANGLIRRFLLQHTQNRSGRVAWNKTIQRSDPIFTESSVFYPSPIVARRINNEESPLTILHEACVRDCYERWGWLIDPKRYHVNFRQRACEWLPYPPETALAYLSKEKCAVFSDREMRVLDLLMQYISSAIRDDSENEVSFFGTKYYWRVWETACKYIFHDDQFIYDNILPQPRWNLKYSEPDTSQRPDVLFVLDGTFYILDAKYYDYQKGMPGGPDIIKQYYYEDTLRSVLQKRKRSKIEDKYSYVERSTNAFVFQRCRRIR